MKFIKIVFLLILFLVKNSSSFSANTIQYNCFRISVFNDSSNHRSLSQVKTILKNYPDRFIASEKIREPFNPDETYWIYLQRIGSNDDQEYILSFRMWVSHMEVYPFPYTTVSCYGGRMVSYCYKKLNDCSVFLDAGSNEYLLKIQTQMLYSKASVKNIRILPTHTYLHEEERLDFIQGFIQGFFLLMLIYNLLLYLVVRKKVHMFYVIYILFNSLYLLFVFGYSEIYLFSNNYKLNLLLFTFQPIGLFFYTLFVRLMMLNHCQDYTPSIDRKTLYPYAWLILAVNLIIASTIFYRIDILIITSRISNLISCIFGMIVLIYFYKKSDSILHIIIAGSIIMIGFGLVSIFYGPIDWFIDNMSFEVGLLIELLLFTYAINRQYSQDIEKQYKAEFEKQKLENQLEVKNRELVFQAIQLSAKDEAILSVRDKIKGLHLSKEVNNSIVNEIQANDRLNKNLWKEFELHFNETHPGFYRALMEKYPELTQNEIKLCAFLRLNLNTKDISMITQKTPHSIEAMRSRIRQKMQLEREINLGFVLAQL